MKIESWLTFPDEHLLLLSKDGAITVGQMRASVAQVQSRLRKENIKSCALYSNDTYEFMVTFLACAHAGIDIILPANNLQEMSHMLNVDCFIGDWSDPLFSVESRQEQKSPPIYNDLKESKVTLYTSGSTGKPKSISRSMSQLLTEIDVLDKNFIQDSEVLLFVATVSQQHIYGLLFTVLWPLLKGHVIWHKLILFEEMVDDINQLQRPWFLVSSPAFLKRLQESQSANNQLKRVFSSGGMLKEQHQLQAQKLLSAPVVQVYGSSETGGIAFRHTQQGWQFFDQVAHKIVEGILWVKSPFCFQSGWQCTHDRVELTGSEFNLLGRNDRIVKIEEKRVSLNAIEQHVLAMDCVADVAALVLEQGRQYIALIIETSQMGIDYISQHGEIELKKRIKESLSQTTEKIAMPRKIRLLTEPIVNAQGKKVHSELIKLLL